MPVDPFLFAHKVGPFHINIGGQWSPLSIRDQMLRGRWAAERALDAGVLGEGKELAVIGAGVGGVTAAMVAVNAGVKTTLFDKDSDPFARHKKCRRWVDPTQYDWPLDHFNAGSIPWTPRLSLLPATLALSSTPPMPLRWPRPNRALALVGDWISQFSTFTLTANALKYFTWNHDCEVTNIRPHATGTMAEVAWHPVGLHGSSFTDPFGLVISAMGFGEECNYLEYPKGTIFPARGYSFWDSDPFEYPGLDWHGTLRRPRVLISGGGDGALQDFIRIATKFKSARDLWSHLSLSTSDSAAIRKAVQDIEDQATRSLPWSANSKHDHAVLDRVMAGLDALATQVRLLPTISAALATALRREYSKLWLVHSCNHFNPSYSLNRFLSLLLIKQLPYEGVGFAYLPGYRLKALRCTHGTPTPPDPALCHWQIHEATFAPHLDCRTAFAPGATDPTIEEEFDVLVLRHGIDPPPLHLMGGAAATIMPSRQVLPYHYSG